MGRINLIRWVKACKESGGIISLIAKRLSIERSMVYDYIKKEPQAQKYLQEAKEEVLDVAESHLIRGITSGDKEDIKWYLSRMGKKRGYIASDNQINVENIQGSSYKFEIIKPDATTTYKVETNSEATTGV